MASKYGHALPWQPKLTSLAAPQASNSRTGIGPGAEAKDSCGLSCCLKSHHIWKPVGRKLWGHASFAYNRNMQAIWWLRGGWKSSKTIPTLGQQAAFSLRCLSHVPQTHPPQEGLRPADMQKALDSNISPPWPQAPWRLPHKISSTGLTRANTASQTAKLVACPWSQQHYFL